MQQLVKNENNQLKQQMLDENNQLKQQIKEIQELLNNLNNFIKNSNTINNDNSVDNNKIDEISKEIEK